MGFFYICNMKKIVNILDISTRFDREEQESKYFYKNEKMLHIKNGVLEINKSPMNRLIEKHKKNVNFVDNENLFNKYRFLHYIFIILGLPLMILIPKSTFYFLYIKTSNIVFDYEIYDIKPKFVRGIGAYLFVVFFILKEGKGLKYLNNFNYIETFDYCHYNWEKLYKSLLSKGYQSSKGYQPKIRIKEKNFLEKNNNIEYYATDGNHRIYLLKQMYPEGKEIEVLFEKKK